MKYPMQRDKSLPSSQWNPLRSIWSRPPLRSEAAKRIEGTLVFLVGIQWPRFYRFDLFGYFISDFVIRIESYGEMIFFWDLMRFQWGFNDYLGTSWWDLSGSMGFFMTLRHEQKGAHPWLRGPAGAWLCFAATFWGDQEAFARMVEGLMHFFHLVPSSWD